MARPVELTHHRHTLSLGFGAVATTDEARAMAWYHFFTIIRRDHRPALEQLRDLLPLYEACSREPATRALELWFDSDDTEFFDDDDCALREAVAAWQSEYRLGGPAAFERVLALLHKWSMLIERARADLFLSEDHGVRPVLLNRPEPPAYRPEDGMNAEEHDRLVLAYRAAVEDALSELGYINVGGRRKPTSLGRHLEWLAMDRFARDALWNERKEPIPDQARGLKAGIDTSTVSKGIQSACRRLGITE